MDIYKKFSLCVIFIPIPFLIIVAALLYFYDAYQVWHKPYWRETRFFTDTATQAKGVIDWYDFDSIIIGSSMLGGTSEIEADEKLGGKWVNLSMGGAKMSIKKVILQYALKHKDIKSVIISLDWIDNIYDNNADDFLYDENQFNNMKVYLNFHFVTCALTWSSSQKCIGQKESYRSSQGLQPPMTTIISEYEGAKQWITRDYNRKKQKKLIEKLENADIPILDVTPKPIDYEKHKRYINNTILSLARENPHVNFYYILPTHTRLTYRMREEVWDFYKWKSVFRLFVEMSAEIPNVKIYGFDDLDYADNLGNYFDLTHYGHDMNSMQLDSIAKNEHILTPKNIDSYLATMQQKIQDYDLQPLIQIAREVKNSESQ